MKKTRNGKTGERKRGNEKRLTDGKKALAGFLVIWIFCLCLSGCSADKADSGKNQGKMKEEEQNVLHVVTEEQYRVQVDTVQSYFQKKHPEIQIELQILKKDEEERTSQIQKLRTEIMAGNGPDVYVLACADELISKEDQKECLFASVDKTMESGVFLPLDSYMQEDDYWKEGSYQEAILKAGQLRGSQYVLPLGCSYYVYAHPENEGAMQGETLEEWLDCVIRSGDQNLKYKMLSQIYYIMAGRLIQPAVDYENRTARFDGDQWSSFLVKYLPEYLSIYQNGTAWNTEEMSGSYLGRIDIELEMGMSGDVSEEKPVIYQAVPDLNGSRTASVTAYGAAGMGTEYPSLCYEFLMLFLNGDMEAGEAGAYLEYDALSGAPVQSRSWKVWLGRHGISDEDRRQEILQSFGELDSAYFPTEVECDLFDEMFSVTNGTLGRETEIEKIEGEIRNIAETYEKRYQSLAQE